MENSTMRPCGIRPPSKLTLTPTFPTDAGCAEYTAEVLRGTGAGRNTVTGGGAGGRSVHIVNTGDYGQYTAVAQ